MYRSYYFDCHEYAWKQGKPKRELIQDTVGTKVIFL